MSNRNQWRLSWFMFTGLLAMLLGLVLALLSEYSFVSILSLVGSLIMAVGAIMTAVASKHVRGR